MQSDDADDADDDDVLAAVVDAIFDFNFRPRPFVIQLSTSYNVICS